MYIGHNLRGEREIKGWSQEALGMAIGLSQGTVSLHESNHHEVGWGANSKLCKSLKYYAGGIIPTSKRCCHTY